MTANPAFAHQALSPLIEGAVADLAARPRVVTEHTARTVLARVAWEAYQAGRAEAIGELTTADAVAPMLGIAARTVRALAARHGIGWRVGERVWLFTPRDVAALRARSTGKAGRPPRATPHD